MRRRRAALLAAVCHCAAASDLAVYSGLDAAAEADATRDIENATLYDHEGRELSTLPSMAMQAHRCQLAYKKAVWEERHDLPPYLYADKLAGVQLGDRAVLGDPRIVYFISVSRKSAGIVVSRLLLALYHSSHLYLVHIDLKTDQSVYDQLAELTKAHPNIRLVHTRRLVQWGAWTMVSIMLDALKTVTAAKLDYDFFINLSDADLALRTNGEIVNFLRPYKGRQFVQVRMGTGEKARSRLAKPPRETASRNRRATATRLPRDRRAQPPPDRRVAAARCTWARASGSRRRETSRTRTTWLSAAATATWRSTPR